MGLEDLRLNSLDRFTKTSPRFMLEEHGGCEVPAGCGGVVLRWINPAAGLPVLLDFFHPTPATLAIDGIPTTSSSMLIAPGRHVLSIELPEPAAEDTALLMLVGRLRLAVPTQPVEQVIVHSVADRSWSPPSRAAGTRVLRGGSWTDPADVVTVSFRMSRRCDLSRWPSSHLAPNIGFRLCRRERGPVSW